MGKKRKKRGKILVHHLNAIKSIMDRSRSDTSDVLRDISGPELNVANNSGWQVEQAASFRAPAAKMNYTAINADDGVAAATTTEATDATVAPDPPKQKKKKRGRRLPSSFGRGRRPTLETKKRVVVAAKTRPERCARYCFAAVSLVSRQHATACPPFHPFT